MAKLMDLSNELILKIGTHIGKTPDKVHLIKVNRRTKCLLIPILYEHLILKHTDYLPNGGRNKYDTITSRITMLRQTLARDDRHLGMAIKYMDIHIQMFSGNPNASLVGFFQLTPCSKHLTLVTTITGEQDHYDKLRVSELGQMLRNVTDTLETLVLSIGLVWMCLVGSPESGYMVGLQKHSW